MSRTIRDDLHLHVNHFTIESYLYYDHKQQPISFTYWVRKSLRKIDREKFLFTDEKYFELDDPFDCSSDRVYAASWQEADEHGRIRPTAKFSQRILIWLGTSKNGLTARIIFELGDTLTHKNYNEAFFWHAQVDDQRLLGDDFIYQHDNARSHTHKDSLA